MAYPIIFFGAFGGVCPTLMKLASTLVANPAADLPLPGFYIAIGLYAILGGGIALALGEQNLRGALFAGIAAPALISNAITGAQDARYQPVPARTSYFEQLISTAAHAQDSKDLQPNSPSKPMETDGNISIVLGNAAATNIPVNICFLKADSSDGTKCSDEIVVTTPAIGVKDIRVPVDTVGVIVAGVRLPITGPATTISISADRAPTPANDFLWALGGRRSTQITDLQARIVP
ncbi:hypothetical protein [Ancylobacter polymorphus]|uniref:Uncharacterized protein n=1 Tax=Ancylobacter polymorphus TaxID=223390 RepID=A0ABU0B645_9HYPH|nr:hypothetical protein [Ancylobacter polymorphus]MDQ0301293.1 hypothetical protein [Ancylobacter polymorphus]